MEDVLDLYEEEYAPDRPVVCFDETSRQLVRDSRPGIGAPPGRVERYDYEYERNGTRNLFVFCEPKAGYRHVEVTKRRTGVDFAEQMRWLVDESVPGCRKDQGCSGQAQYPQARLSVRDVRSFGGTADSEATGVPSYAEARKLAEHGGDRVEHLQQAVSQALNR